jgi:hypothetical protein
VTDRLSELEDALLDAVGSADYAAGQRALVVYCEEARGCVREDPPNAAATGRRVSRVLEWALRVAQAAQAQYRQELSSLGSVSRYRGAPSVTHTIRIDA